MAPQTPPKNAHVFPDYPDSLLEIGLFSAFMSAGLDECSKVLQISSNAMGGTLAACGKQGRRLPNTITRQVTNNTFECVMRCELTVVQDAFEGVLSVI